MKKTLSLLLVLAMVIGMVCMFAGCKEKDEASVYYLNFKPEFNDALTELAAKYTEETGIPVNIVTAASGHLPASALR